MPPIRKLRRNAPGANSSALSLIDPSDVRRDVSLLQQNATLFHGSLRDNLAMGRPQASDSEILHALHLAGALRLVQRMPQGLDHTLREGGLGLSGGQRKALLLARTLVRESPVLLLDEPTASMDEMSERHIIEHLQSWLKERTLVVATHRLTMLQWVDRVLILEGGRVVSDEAKESFLARRAKLVGMRGAAAS